MQSKKSTTLSKQAQKGT